MARLINAKLPASRKLELRYQAIASILDPVTSDVVFPHL
jgi:hypothetical protein